MLLKLTFFREDDVQVGQGPIKPRNKSRKNLDVTDIF